MGRCAVVVPDSKRIELSEGDWIEVKKQLTYGDQLAMQTAMVSEFRGTDRVTPNFEGVGTGMVCAYLIDWSFVDTKGKQIPIDTEARKLSAIKNLPVEIAREIRHAIEAHADAMEAEAAAKKLTASGATEP